MKMKCTECGAEINDNEIYCPKCGAEIVYTQLPEAVQNEDAPENGNAKKKKVRNTSDKKSKNKLIFAVRIAGILIIIGLIIFVIIYIAGTIRGNEGRKIFDSVPLGRDISFIEKEAGTSFLNGESSKYGAVNYIAEYDHICESEKSVTVDGITLPEWAVLLRENSSGAAEEAVLYNFSLLKHSWMGSRLASKLEATSVEYGMSIKSAERAIGLKPYTIVKESKENISVYVYRYHYTDSESSNNCVMNFCIEVSDVDNQVKNVYDEQLDYLNLILQTNVGGNDN